MPEPKIAATSPAVLKLEPGDYWWCACGQSNNQPFCDGSHKGSEFTPIHFTMESARVVALCQCKRSANKPYCDGTHKSLIKL